MSTLSASKPSFAWKSTSLAHPFPHLEERSCMPTVSSLLFLTRSPETKEAHTRLRPTIVGSIAVVRALYARPASTRQLGRLELILRFQNTAYLQSKHKWQCFTSTMMN